VSAGRQGGWPRWLGGGTVLVAGAAIVTVYAMFLLVGTVLRDDPPIGADVLAFVTAARLAIEGQAAVAYDWAAFGAAQAAVPGAPAQITGSLGWLNPPHFFFAVLPLAAFSYGWAWLLWGVATALLLGLAAWSVLPRPAAVVAVLAAPAVMLNLSVGQNGVLVAALFAWIFALLDRRPVAAGIALGLLTMKPQFGLLLPVLLALTGRWRVFGVAAVTALATMLLAWAAFGSDAWLAFLPSITGNADRMLGGTVSPRMQSVYAFLAGTAGAGSVAAAGHAAVALLATLVALTLWLRRPEVSAEVRAAAAIAASFLITPYVWGYDAASIAVAALFLVRAALRRGWLAAEKSLLVLACALPVVLPLVQQPLVSPLGWAILLCLAWRRDAADRRAVAGSDVSSPVPTGSMSAGT
jgi:hypothetical protein